MANALLLPALALALVLILAVPGKSAEGPLVIEPDGVEGSRLLFWATSSLERVYPNSAPGDRQTLEVLMPRGGQASFQLCCRNERVWPLHIECQVEAPEGLSVTVRRVGYVPVRFHTTEVDPSLQEGSEYIPGYVPDPLWPDQVADVGPGENVSFWVTVRANTDAQPGSHTLKARLSFHEGTQQAELEAKARVSRVVLQPRHDFPVVHWWRAECLWDWYETEPFDERWWQLAEAYLTDLHTHGTDVCYVPSLFMRRETFKRPAHLLIIDESSPGQYSFDFSRVERFIKLARKTGFEQFEWPHLWIYWGLHNAMPVYNNAQGEAKLLWPIETGAFSDTYRVFLEQYLPAWHTFLLKEKLLRHSWFHLSDEPGAADDVDRYRKAREWLRELAPWMKVMDALSDIEYGRQGLTDTPIPVISAAQAYIDEGIPHWVYFCCGPRGPYLQRLLDTPLTTIRMSGWLFYRLRADGFLHWGYNYWHAMEQERLVDPFSELCGEAWPGIPPGDPFLVYPGPTGPMDSIRWEVFAESLQDYALLQTLLISPDDLLLADIKGYADFPRDADWIKARLARLLGDEK